TTTTTASQRDPRISIPLLFGEVLVIQETRSDHDGTSQHYPKDQAKRKGDAHPYGVSLQANL
ncbi:hypothetical protein KY285_029978, partial [Solanum tuberosum]